MWKQILRYLPEFERGVVSALDDDGQPFSARCEVTAGEEPRLALALPEGLPLETGPACLLFHRHDERLWNLKSFVVRGRLRRDERGWWLEAEQFVPGAGIGGLLSYWRFLRDGRRTTARYLAKRGLARPEIPWVEWEAVIAKANKKQTHTSR